MKKCPHFPLTLIKFDAGNIITEYLLCDSCRKHPIFNQNIISISMDL